MKILDQIEKPNDIKKLSTKDLNQLAQEIRDYLLEVTSRNGGHLASNLGVVEITIALHRFMSFPEDKIVFDVGHQSYVHKILTGRKQELMTLRQLNGISGFSDPNESDCDAFVAGHASTALSVALGIAHARELKKTNEKVVAVIGDGSLTGGMMQEALNNASNLESNLIIILNDNERSISESVGGLSRYLGKIRLSVNYNKVKHSVQKQLTKIPVIGEPILNGVHAAKETIKKLLISSMYFEDMGITYIGPIDGHDVKQVYEALENASTFQGPVLIHCLTKKGKGYHNAEIHPAFYHGVEPFDIVTGKPLKEKCGKTFTDVFSDKMLQLAEKNEKLVAITAAMPYGTGLYNFKKKYPERFFDVGIAEQHAITFAAGLASSGIKPVVAVYSTFLQRAYDQIVHDVCMMKLPVVFAIDRAGLVGSDGKTHQGIFDESFLSSIPNLKIMSPKNGKELEEMLEFAVNYNDGPIAIRYSKEKIDESFDEYDQKIEMDVNEVMIEGKDLCIMASGAMVKIAYKACLELQEKGYNPTLVNVRFLHDIDYGLMEKLAQNHSKFLITEETVYTGSYAERCKAAFNRLDIRTLTLPDKYIEHGKIDELRERYHLTVKDIVEKVLEN